MIERTELKYIISIERMQDFKQSLKPYFQKHRDHSAYNVNSLYFDHITMGSLSEKVEGLSKKHKVRLRYYNDDKSQLWLEHKLKSDNLCLKKRFKVKDSISIDPSVKPKIMVSYFRQVYECLLDQRIRINFDSMIKANQRSCIDLTPGQTSILNPFQVVFEIKLFGQMPIWLYNCLAEFDLDNVSYSKYSEAMRLTGRE